MKICVYVLYIKKNPKVSIILFFSFNSNPVTILQKKINRRVQQRAAESDTERERQRDPGESESETEERDERRNKSVTNKIGQDGRSAGVDCAGGDDDDDDGDERKKDNHDDDGREVG